MKLLFPWDRSPSQHIHVYHQPGSLPTPQWPESLLGCHSVGRTDWITDNVIGLNLQCFLPPRMLGGQADIKAQSPNLLITCWPFCYLQHPSCNCNYLGVRSRSPHQHNVSQGFTMKKNTSVTCKILKVQKFPLGNRGQRPDKMFIIQHTENRIWIGSILSNGKLRQKIMIFMMEKPLKNFTWIYGH